ncbi:4-(cytidine 5'-diphospho)-2-C-methyl-D-erythritol kinase [Luteimonas terricola]|uniref:4-diphosphocytidyl-2-C-methyl-D-erythritol kinase n=1 Tax=Luteimonas terricola TaxID=645597 RepID=A0ABQ2E945_9GAMM|nr:4-(cytidine 5'-diphospho)-2-C-methyl-D-erythritol kinase [Luteimonas terricola]GGK00593.1 4-diphosphocytidyl-2-C-methyl-D-erythritol kinase [Luteimonas terricola]
MTAAAWSAWPAPAKLNLFLHITGRRADGYHELQTVFRLLDWGDTVHLRPRADGRIVRHGDDLAAVPEASDLSLRAAENLKKSFNVSEGADIRVEKRVPAGGGFGGGSSDAATVLMALDVLWGLQAGTGALAAIGAGLGADVPVFVHGHNAWAEGVGERLVPVELPPAWYLIADPGVHVATATLFQTPELTRDAPPATIVDFASGAPLGNVFEPVLRRLEPAIEATFQALSRAGTPRLTGTGSGCFVEFAAREPAEDALARLPQGLRARVVAGVSRSPLLDALAARSPQGRRQVAQGTGF